MWTVTTVPLEIIGSFLRRSCWIAACGGHHARRICFSTFDTPQVAAVILWVWIGTEVGARNNLRKCLSWYCAGRRSPAQTGPARS